MSLQERVDEIERKKAAQTDDLLKSVSDQRIRDAEQNRLNIERAERLGRPFLEDLNAGVLNNTGKITVEAKAAAGRCEIVWPNPKGWDSNLMIEVDEVSISVCTHSGDYYGTVKMSDEKLKEKVEELIAGGYCGTIPARSRD